MVLSHVWLCLARPTNPPAVGLYVLPLFLRFIFNDLLEGQLSQNVLSGLVDIWK